MYRVLWVLAFSVRASADYHVEESIAGRAFEDTFSCRILRLQTELVIPELVIPTPRDGTRETRREAKAETSWTTDKTRPL